MHAMARHPDRDVDVELVTCQDLSPTFLSDAYPIHRILPILHHRKSFRTPAHWFFSRATYYPRRDLFFARWLATRPDIKIVHFQEWTPSLAGPLFRAIRRQGKKIFYTVHNIVPHSYPPLTPKKLVHLYIRRASRMCDGLFVHTERLAEELKRFLNGRHPPIYVTPHGVWTVDHPSAPISVEERLSWKKLLFFGCIRRNKGLDLLLRAAESLPDYEFTIAGEPIEPDYFRTEVMPRIEALRRRGIKINLEARFLGEEEIAPLFASHSAIALPYTADFSAQSGVVFMALAHSTPVVAAEVGGLRDLLERFGIGTSFSAATPEALSAAVRELESGASRQSIARAIDAARDYYSWSRMAAATMDGYRGATSAAGDAVTNAAATASCAVASALWM